MHNDLAKKCTAKKYIFSNIIKNSKTALIQKNYLVKNVVFLSIFELRLPFKSVCYDLLSILYQNTPLKSPGSTYNAVKRKKML